MWMKFGLGYIPKRLTKYCPQSSGVDPRMYRNGESLTSAIAKSAQLDMTAAASFNDKSELVKNRD